ncbi:hypothetical protein KSS87_017856 [Heliosperma pusillum]|nr:hypothetical protein KSS87_017856 [Heliosperma pusillum]
MTPELLTQVSKSSPESNFRELDDAFLQTQTRIWLGEVLQIRLDEETDISVILADGKLLSELSEVLSRMLPSLSVDATPPKTNETKSFVSSKSSQRYMPYYNVGSFLKMCKNLGLDSIDLFTPSDVVEKRNTRKVCMCIRSLSKRARSKNLNVPDFDSVTCTVTMPTNMVECIRKSLEMSQSSSPLSVGLEADKFSGVRYINRISYSASTVSNECSSDICDDAQSSGAMVGEFNLPSDYNYEAESPISSCLKVIGDYSSTLQLNTRDLKDEEDDQCEYLSPSNGESVGSPCSQYFSDQEIGMPSSDYLGSHISGKVDLNSEAKPIYENGDSLPIPINWEDGHLIFENHSDDHENKDQFDCVSLDDQGPDIWVSRSESPTHPEIGSEKSSCSSIGHASCTSQVEIKEENLEFSSYNGENYMSQVINAEENSSCDSVDLPGQLSFLVDQSSYPVDSSPNSCESSSGLAIKSNGIDDHLTSLILAVQIGESDNDTSVSSETDSSLALNHTEEYPHQDVMGHDVSRPYTPQSSSSVNMLLAKDNKMCCENSQETWAIPEDFRPSDVSDNVDVNDIDDALVLSDGSYTLHDPQLEIGALGNLEDTDKGMTGRAKQEDDSEDMPKHKPQRKLLNSVIKGTALVGLAIVLLHLRKNRQENLSKVRKQPVEVLKISTPLPSSKKGQKSGKASSVYPAEKLNFGF